MGVQTRHFHLHRDQVTPNFSLLPDAGSVPPLVSMSADRGGGGGGGGPAVPAVLSHVGRKDERKPKKRKKKVKTAVSTTPPNRV